YASVSFDPNTTPNPSVTFAGLPAGTWTLQASLYDTDGVTTGWDWSGKPSGTTGQPLLLYSASQDVGISSGTSSDVTLLAYKPGDIGSVTVVEPSLVSTVAVTDTNNVSSSTVTSATPLTLAATILDSTGNPATEQRVTWTSSDLSVAEVSALSGSFPTAQVKIKGQGTVSITATSVEGQMTGVTKAATYTLDIEPEIWGDWTGTGYYDNWTNAELLRVSRDPQTHKLVWVQYSGVNYPWGYSTPNVNRGVVAAVNGGWEFDRTQMFGWDSTTNAYDWYNSGNSSMTGSVDPLGRLIQGEGDTVLTRMTTPWVTAASAGLSPGPVGASLPQVDQYYPVSVRWGPLGVGPLPTVGDVFWTVPSTAPVDLNYGWVHQKTAGVATVTATSWEDPTVTTSVTVGTASYAGLPENSARITAIYPDPSGSGWVAAGFAGGKTQATQGLAVRLDSTARPDSAFGGASGGSILFPNGGLTTSAALPSGAGKLWTVGASFVPGASPTPIFQQSSLASTVFAYYGSVQTPAWQAFRAPNTGTLGVVALWLVSPHQASSQTADPVTITLVAGSGGQGVVLGSVTSNSPSGTTVDWVN
ncbi:MAG TPA: hypothetical protein VMB23_04275, partial [Spirochaetia bacterium]|nr:hypothetical protein [Spirochaetia bacterium]